MGTARSWALLCFLLITYSACSVSLSSFVVPAQVWQGQVFEALLSGTATGSGGNAALLMQLPNGFTIEGAEASVDGGAYLVPQAGFRDNPSLVSLVTPEPGHYLASFEAFAPASMNSFFNVQLKLYLRAPQATGTFSLKAIGAATTGTGGYQVGITSFSAVSTAPGAQSLTVVASPVSPFVLEPTGLLNPSVVSAFVPTFGDVDGDGRDDLGYGQAGAGDFVWLSRANGPWLPAHPPLAGTGASYVGVAFGDLDGDGHPDLVDTSGRILFGNGGTAWTNGPSLPLLIPIWGGVAIGDVDGDGRPDIALCAGVSDAVQVFRNQGNRTFADWSNALPAGTNGPVGSKRIVLADVDGDGKCDIVTCGSIGLRVWRGDGRGGWFPANQGLPVASCFAVGDLDGNGISDLVLGSGAAIGPAAFEFNGNVWLQHAMTGTPLWSATDLALLDYDRDGWIDCVLAGTSSPFLRERSIALLRNLGGQGFASPVTLSAALAPYADARLAVGDFDGDSWPDFAAAPNGDPLLVFHNTGSGLSPFGSGCGAVGFATPRTTAIGQPTLGNSAFACELQSAPPNASGLLWLGLSRRFAFGQPILPFDLGQLGAPGCTILASQDAVAFVVADPQGRAQLPLPIPNVAAFARFTLFAQSAVFAPGANNLGLLVGNGLAAKIP